MSLEIDFQTIPTYPDGLDDWYITPATVYLSPVSGSSGNSVTVYWTWTSGGSYTSSGLYPGNWYNIGYMPSGESTLYYYASGSGAISSNYSHLFKCEFLNPTLTSYSPLTETWRDVITVTASGTESATSGSAINEMYVSLDGWVIYQTYSGGLSCQIDTKNYFDGIHYLSVAAIDDAGHATASGMNVFVDNAAPTLVIDDLPDKITVSGYAVSGEAYDMYSNVDKVEHTWQQASGTDSWREVTYTSGADSPYTKFYIRLNSLSDGPWILKFRALDSVGNYTPSGEFVIKPFMADV